MSSFSKQNYAVAALSKIGIAQSASDLTAEQIMNAVEQLDTMIARWSSDGINIGWVFGTGDITGLMTEVPFVCDGGIIANLAILLSVNYGRQYNPMLNVEAVKG